MFQEIKNQEAEQKPDIQAFLALYAKFQAGTAWLAKRESEGLDNSPHLVEFRQIEASIDRQWENMPDEQKDAILNALVASGAIPTEVGQAAELFGGKVVSVT